MADGTSGIPGPVGLGAQSYHEAMGCIWLHGCVKILESLESQEALRVRVSTTLMMFDA